MEENNTIKYLYIDDKSSYYKQVVELRYQVFFKPFNCNFDTIYDEFENKSIHFIAIYDEKVVGYIRLTIENEIGIISQFVVSEEMRGVKSIAIKLFKELLRKAKLENVKKLTGNIRLHMEVVAKYFGFNVSEESFPSKKTGLPHKRIEMILE
jgi:N-acyl-L-homoserine lactone synthetase